MIKLNYKGWEDFFAKFSEEYLISLDKIMSHPRTTPSKDVVFKLFTYPPEHYKIGICDISPHKMPLAASGLAFGSESEFTPIKTQILVLKIKDLYPDSNIDETLEDWWHKGVFLMNLSFTTEIGVENAHKEQWKEFTSVLIKYLSNLKWLIWGKMIENTEFFKDSIIYRDVSPFISEKRAEHAFGQSLKSVEDGITW